nr:MAG TPA: hypothetical protein [Caudoviricetes sp.]
MICNHEFKGTNCFIGPEESPQSKLQHPEVFHVVYIKSACRWHCRIRITTSTSWRREGTATLSLRFCFQNRKLSYIRRVSRAAWYFSAAASFSFAFSGSLQSLRFRHSSSASFARFVNANLTR